jgi:hypothetical protein
MAGVHLGTWLHPDSILKGFVQEPKPNGLIHNETFNHAEPASNCLLVWLQCA